MKVPVPQLERFCLDALRGTGLGEADARTTTDVLVTTDTWGVFTHGTKSLGGYLRRLRAGGLRVKAVPKVVKEGPAWALVDADSAIGMVGSKFAMQVAIAKAKASGIGYVGVRNSCHFGAAGFYAAMAAAEGMIGIAMANDVPSMTAPGSRAPVLGTNPLAYAVPNGTAHPILLDMATSAVAGGKVYAAAALGQPIPTGWIVDAQGRPSTDPKIYPHAASMLPMAGHKGYGIALLIETLSAALTGASMAGHVLSWSFDDPTRATDHGAAFLAFEVNAFMPRDEFERRVQQTIAEIRSAPRAPGVERIYLPGEMEWERRAIALREGIDLPPDVIERLRPVAEGMGVELGKALS